mmetsp:Transcript_2864/g.5034  ORF Transcript_2864/g.5034 Transcript_2864/m.5034 type:complete len:92 (+) Transcript_2864:182-457(+)
MDFLSLTPNQTTNFENLFRSELGNPDTEKLNLLYPLPIRENAPEAGEDEVDEGAGDDDFNGEEEGELNEYEYKYDEDFIGKEYDLEKDDFN